MKKTGIFLLALVGLTISVWAQEVKSERNSLVGDTATVSLRPYAYYADQYAQFEQMAKQRFAVLTASGSANAAARPIRGYSRMNPSDFNTNSSMLRTAQRQMRQIRNQASAEGYEIPLSPWEEATVDISSSNR